MPNRVFEQNLQKNVKSDHHHQILHIQYGLVSNFNEFLDQINPKKVWFKKEKKGKSPLNSTYSN